MTLNKTPNSAPEAYGTTYYLGTNGQPHSYFSYDPVRDSARAQAMVSAVGLRPGGRILDFGCGVGAMTAACNSLGHPTIGVDFSPDAIENALPEARDYVHQIGTGGGLSLSDFPNDMVDLVIAKDVFEHVPEDDLQRLGEELLCIGRQVLAVIPTTDEAGSFVCGLYNQDKTHVTRLTRGAWLGFFPCATVLDLADLTPRVRPSRQVSGTLSVLLRETDTQWRQQIMNERIRSRTPVWRQLLRPPDRGFDLDFDSLFAIMQS